MCLIYTTRTYVWDMAECVSCKPVIAVVCAEYPHSHSNDYLYDVYDVYVEDLSFMRLSKQCLYTGLYVYMSEYMNYEYFYYFIHLRVHSFD